MRARLMRIAAIVTLALVASSYGSFAYAVCVCDAFCPFDGVGNYESQEPIGVLGMTCYYDDGHQYTCWDG